MSGDAKIARRMPFDASHSDRIQGGNGKRSWYGERKKGVSPAVTRKGLETSIIGWPVAFVRFLAQGMRIRGVDWPLSCQNRQPVRLSSLGSGDGTSNSSTLDRIREDP